MKTTFKCIKHLQQSLVNFEDMFLFVGCFYTSECLIFLEAFNKSSPELRGAINLQHLVLEWTLLVKSCVTTKLLGVFAHISKTSMLNTCSKTSACLCLKYSVTFAAGAEFSCLGTLREQAVVCLQTRG